MAMEKKVNVIGAGLSGCEAAYQLARRGIKVKLYEMKPCKKSPAHTSDNFAELVCSNSLRSADPANAVGLLKEELRLLGSLIMSAAYATKVDAGGALAVDRGDFSTYITDEIKSNANIEIIREEYTRINRDEITIIATGPLTSEGLSGELERLLGEQHLHFFDAAAPIVAADSIDLGNAFIADRYDKGEGSYINCPMDKEQYEHFYRELIAAKKVEFGGVDTINVFEGCMPVESMAARGGDTMRYGMLKPVGLTDPKTGRWPYAVVQLRKENLAGSSYNLVGFQTRLTFSEQKRVFGLIPALKNAEYLRYGVMHRNTFINSPKVMNLGFSLKEYPNIFLAGQMTGVEGYVESTASGYCAAISAAQLINGKGAIDFTQQTAIGALEHYVVTPNANFQPMNINFGILSPLQEKIRDKKKQREQISRRAIDEIEKIKTLIGG